MWRPAYVAIGSNLDDPRARVEEALARLARLDRSRLVARSRLYRSRPMGPQDQPDFLNAVAGLLTALDTRELLEAMLSVERAMGRRRRERWGPRIVDLDLIWIPGAPIAEPDLEVPHPGVRERNFVLYPLADIAPTLVIPGCGRVSELKERIGGEGIVVLDDERSN
ncbi:MAG TPA: 2-amino-4-hydroxy-6-hydroxymethyldihydropteridine diphosphokinase [Steroidobacteraceae bacterium]|nr:2-amino-4-hydroxy-6-hydroxymethyldihydropteridine diphosphokinase [Steroidobacteraceae bacterium]